jgi:hypothetical protein
MSIVAPAIRSSSVQNEGLYHGWFGVEGSAERPRARRKIWSMCARAAVVVGEDEVGVSVREVEVLGKWKGSGM